MAFLKWNFQSNVYVAELKAGGAKLTTPRRLTLDERNDWPNAWTSDSRAVLFWSDRNGSNQVFKQNIDQQTAETVVAGPGSLDASDEPRWSVHPLFVEQTQPTASPER